MVPPTSVYLQDIPRRPSIFCTPLDLPTLHPRGHVLTVVLRKAHLPFAQALPVFELSPSAFEGFCRSFSGLSALCEVRYLAPFVSFPGGSCSVRIPPLCATWTPPPSSGVVSSALGRQAGLAHPQALLPRWAMVRPPEPWMLDYTSALPCSFKPTFVSNHLLYTNVAAQDAAFHSLAVCANDGILQFITCRQPV